TVTDPTGAVVANAKVTAKNAGTSATRATTTNEQGLYGFANLLPGVYQVTVEATGFSVAQLQAVVSVGSRVGVDIRLEVGRTDTVVQV
ncbi:MAG TPA: hypothetical protein DEH78_30310, partial [Solibacterales bacterium]|nr:hypothetical protein [Bryobacterales bacterium]